MWDGFNYWYLFLISVLASLKAQIKNFLRSVDEIKLTRNKIIAEIIYE